MRPLPQDEARRWFDQAQQDLADARYMTEGSRHNVACFLAQQAAEKALKAFLYARGAVRVHGHSVGELCEEARRIEPSFQTLAPQASPLDKYYIPTRYPNGLP
ncbi:MAG: HEPN domain-containing protein, partial [Chloroflexi bacterium]|nr:HEPN domain-containing protein [Chloroflexota bacterium]